MVSAPLDCPFCDYFIAADPHGLARHIQREHHLTGNYGSSDRGADRFRHNPDASAFVPTNEGGSREGSPDRGRGAGLDAASSESTSREGYMANGRSHSRFAAQERYRQLRERRMRRHLHRRLATAVG